MTFFLRHRIRFLLCFTIVTVSAFWTTQCQNEEPLDETNSWALSVPHDNFTNGALLDLRYPTTQIAVKDGRVELPTDAMYVVLRESAKTALSPEQQQTIAKQLGEKVQRFEMWTDDDGNITGLIFINHQALTKSAGEKPGITDADLRQLKQFPKLTAVNFEAQPIGDAGLQVLRDFPHLKQVGFHYMAKASGASATPDFIEVIDGMRDLEIIEIKHNFAMKAINVQKLKGPFPKVWRLVLDTPLTAEQTMHMIRLCPNVRDLQLHRTEVSPEQLAAIGRLLPKLEVLWLKVNGGLKAGHLESMSSFRTLRIFSPQSFKAQVDYDDGWNSLSTLSKLKRLEIFGNLGEGNKTAIEQLKMLRPDLIVSKDLTRSRNYNGL